jgi:TonB family protein
MMSAALLLAACASSRQSEHFFDEGAYVASARGMPSLADKGDPVAELDLGYLYEHGLGVPQDLAKAQEYYQKASAQGVIRADTCLALLWSKQNPHDVSRSIELLKRADAAGDQYASYYLSHIYEDGVGVPKDAAEAARYKERAGTAMQDAYVSYMKEMKEHITANQRFPVTAVAGHYGGNVKVEFSIEAPYAKDAKIAASSGHADLDDAAIAAIYQTYYPSMPPGVWPPRNFMIDIKFETP